jgi:hypothetical protein
MNISLALGLFAAAIAASTLGGMLGMASGIFIVPLLTIVWHVDLHVAIGASIVSVIACSCASAGPFLKHGLTNIRLAIVLETATTVGALSGVLLIGIVPVRFLFLLFALILLLSCQQMLARRGEPVVGEESAGARRWAVLLKLDASYPEPSSGRPIPYRVQRVPLGMTFMFGAGLVSALLGIGSGVLKIPAMDTALRLPIKVSSATSNFMISVTASASAVAYLMRGDIVPAIAGPVALGSVAGSLLGARFLMRVPNERLRLLFVAVLLVLAVQMLVSAWGAGTTVAA